jgi:hypothetical protein
MDVGLMNRMTPHVMKVLELNYRRNPRAVMSI